MQLEICGVSFEGLPVRGYRFNPGAARPGEARVTEVIAVTLAGTPAELDAWIQSLEVGLWQAGEYQEKRVYLEQFIRVTPVAGGSTWRSPVLWGTVNRAAGGGAARGGAARERGAMQGVEITLVRPDYWEADSATDLVSPAATVGNGSIAPNSNRLEVDGRLLGGTLPAPVEVTIENTHASELYGYIYLGCESWLDQFDPRLEGEDMGAGDAAITQTVVVDAKYSGGEAMQLVGALTTARLLGTWDFAEAALNREYRVLAALPTMDANVSLQARWSYGTAEFASGEWVSIDREVVDLGVFRLPPWNIRAGSWLPPHLTLEIWGNSTVAGDHTLVLDYAYLLPLSGGSAIFLPDIDNLRPNDRLWYDGENCLTYTNRIAGPSGPEEVEETAYASHLALGGPLAAVPGNIGTLHLVWAEDGGEHDARWTAGVTVSARARVRSI